MSIVLLAILAVMWVAFLLPAIAPRQRRVPGSARRRRGWVGEGWRPTPDLPARATARSSATARARAGRPRRGPTPAGRSVLRRRQVLLGLTLATAVSIRVRYMLGGHWWIAEAVAGALLSAYVVALVVQGFRRGGRARPALPAPPARPALPPPQRAAAALPSPASPSPEPPRRRRLRWRRRAQGAGGLWGAPLLEGQGPPTPESAGQVPTGLPG